MGDGRDEFEKRDEWCLFGSMWFWAIDISGAVSLFFFFPYFSFFDTVAFFALIYIHTYIREKKCNMMNPSL
eukprot:28245_2